VRAALTRRKFRAAEFFWSVFSEILNSQQLSAEKIFSRARIFSSTRGKRVNVTQDIYRITFAGCREQEAMNPNEVINSVF
jgi:hypothetical protein